MVTKSKKGLGRGLSALFGDQAQESEKKLSNITQKLALIGDLERNKYQPRYNFREEKLDELAESIKKNGIIQPIAVRPGAKENKYEIIAGERRWIAAQRAGLHEVPIVILNLNDNEALEVAIVENIQREDLNVIEEAKGYERLNNEFNYDHEKIANFMSKSRSHISNTLRLLKLPKDIIGLIEEGLLTAGQARPLVGLGIASNIAEEIVKRKLSARQVEQLVNEKRKSSRKPNKLDANLLHEQKNLESALGLKVIVVNRKNNSGKVTIEYKDLDQFELLSNLLKQ
jgi:ParB family chromosome partitioning protein